MAEGDYEVTSSPKVTEDFKTLLREVRERGLLRAVLPSARWIMEELARTPMSFGESRDYLPRLELHLRVGFVGPLMVEFAVHEASRRVLIRRSRLTPPHPPD
jgi:hypothetical protein